MSMNTYTNMIDTLLSCSDNDKIMICRLLIDNLSCKKDNDYHNISKDVIRERLIELSSDY